MRYATETIPGPLSALFGQTRHALGSLLLILLHCPLRRMEVKGGFGAKKGRGQILRSTNRPFDLAILAGVSIRARQRELANVAGCRGHHLRKSDGDALPSLYKLFITWLSCVSWPWQIQGVGRWPVCVGALQAGTLLDIFCKKTTGKPAPKSGLNTHTHTHT